MKALRDLGWPHLVSTDRLHTSRSTPALKHTDSARSLQSKNIQASGSQLRRSSEGASSGSTTTQTGQSKSLTDSRLSSALSEEFITTKSPPTGVIPALQRSKPDVDNTNQPLTPSASTDEIVQKALPDTPMEESSFDSDPQKPTFKIRKSPAKRYEPLADYDRASIVDSLYFEAINTRQSEMDALSFDIAASPQERINGSRFEVEHIFQEVNDSNDSLAPVAVALRQKESNAEAAITSTPRIEIIRPSIVLDVSPIPYKLSNAPCVEFLPDSPSSPVSNSSLPYVDDRSRSITPIMTGASPSPSLDGPAPEALSKASNQVQPTGNGGSAVADVGEGVGGIAPTGGAGGVVATLPSCCPVPATVPTDTNLPLKITDGMPDLLDPASVAGALEVPTALKVPGQPLDQSGLISSPPFPNSKISKKQKVKLKTQKLIRIGRRVLMRKPIASLILGRQLAGPTVTILKVISRGGQVPDAVAVVGKVATVAPDSVPAPLPI